VTQKKAAAQQPAALARLGPLLPPGPSLQNSSTSTKRKRVDDVIEELAGSLIQSDQQQQQQQMQQQMQQLMSLMMMKMLKDMTDKS